MGKVALGIFLTFFGLHVYAEDLVLKCVGIAHYPAVANRYTMGGNVEEMGRSLIVDTKNKLVLSDGNFANPGSGKSYTEFGTAIHWMTPSIEHDGGELRQRNILNRVTGEYAYKIEVKKKDEEEWRTTHTWIWACENAQPLF